jgi:hypothetical protein
VPEESFIDRNSIGLREPVQLPVLNFSFQEKPSMENEGEQVVQQRGQIDPMVESFLPGLYVVV